MQVFDFDGARIAAQIDGSSDDAMVLIHGFPLSHAMWDQQISALSAKHLTIAIDLRGMGASSVTPGPYLMETLAGDVAALLDTLGVERATLVGHSLGGYVALAFARMYVERVARLALVCSRIDADAPARVSGRNEIASRAESNASNAEFCGEMFAAMFSNKTREKHPEIIEKARKIAEKNDFRGLAAMQRGMALREGSYDIAGDLEMPVLMVAGAEDALLPVADAQAMAACFPAGRLEVAEHSGHLPMLEEPAWLDGVLASFTGG